MDDDPVAGPDSRTAGRRPIGSRAALVIGAHQAFERGLDLLAGKPMRIDVEFTAAGKHVRHDDVDARFAVDPFPVQAQQRQTRPPVAGALLPKRDGHAGVAILVALYQPFETEIDQCRRLDEELARNDGVRIVALERRRLGRDLRVRGGARDRAKRRDETSNLPGWPRSRRRLSVCHGPPGQNP
jgi:hypothetical protein